MPARGPWTGQHRTHGPCVAGGGFVVISVRIDGRSLRCRHHHRGGKGQYVDNDSGMAGFMVWMRRAV